MTAPIRSILPTLSPWRRDAGFITAGWSIWRWHVAYLPRTLIRKLDTLHFLTTMLRGKTTDLMLQRALHEFEEKFPELVIERKATKDQVFMGAVEGFLRSDSAEKTEELILVGATHCVWPVGTSFTLTYPWDLDGKGRPVRFRKDLTDFMKRRIIVILRKAGKLGHSDLFGMW